MSSPARRLLLIAGAGSGKTEVMARRVAWWLADGVPKDSIVAFTFTEKAAEEMQFRIRRYIDAITPEGGNATLGGMYVGTIHSYCFKLLKELNASEYHNYDIMDEIARYALVQRRFHNLLGLPAFQTAISPGRQYRASQTETTDRFLYAYDLLNEYNVLRVELPERPRPTELGAPRLSGAARQDFWSMSANRRPHGRSPGLPPGCTRICAADAFSTSQRVNLKQSDC
ncbi:uvrD/REP helicase N-terminal domain protein [Mycobacterium xenopi 4042]|uniref:UvrD/REP helicase N-terminal domain protein n=1 Tax=Mycobacterium xenopi 4042 TaxID=1299334 RepID=X8CAF0_MYCXE|nr:uvrD/REP helicase N-terminal domain protein [Mycobacterium xenopi 4042]